MRGKEQLREIDIGSNIENGTLLISQLKYECVDIIDKLFVVYHVIWTMVSAGLLVRQRSLRKRLFRLEEHCATVRDKIKTVLFEFSEATARITVSIL